MEILFLIIGMIIGGGVVWFVMNRKVSELEKDLRRTRRELEEEEEIAGGFEEFNQRMREIIESRKEEILEVLQDTEYIQNNDVADMFEVSSATAHRYLTELVEEGRIEQIGEAGRSVHYRLSQ